MSDVQIKWRMKEFVRIANEANVSICGSIAEKVAESARSGALENHPEYAKFIHTATDERSSVRDWAHSTVINAHPAALKIESKYGTLARAFGGGS